MGNLSFLCEHRLSLGGKVGSSWEDMGARPRWGDGEQRASVCLHSTFGLVQRTLSRDTP